MTQTDTTAFNIVFEGGFVDGRDPAVAQTAFARKFGDTAADQVFSQERAILKRNVTQEAALKMQGVLAEIGLMVALTPTVEPATTTRRKSKGTASIVERAAQRAQTRKQSLAAHDSATHEASPALERPVEPNLSRTNADDTSPTATGLSTNAAAPAIKWLLVLFVLLVPLTYLALNNFAQG